MSQLQVNNRINAAVGPGKFGYLTYMQINMTEMHYMNINTNQYKNIKTQIEPVYLWSHVWTSISSTCLFHQYTIYNIESNGQNYMYV